MTPYQFGTTTEMSNLMATGSSAAATSCVLLHERDIEREVSYEKNRYCVDCDCDPRCWPGILPRLVRFVASSGRGGSDTVNINLATDPGKMKQDLHAAKDKATELTGGVTDDVKADGQVQRQCEVK